MKQTPLNLYHERIRDGALQADSAQEKAAQALARLYDELVAEKPPRTLWQTITGARGKALTPKGLYLYGSVGRGKSMLMDLFYESLPESPGKRRVHFHEFMIGVHDYIHSCRDARTGVDEALPSLAKKIAQDSPVLCFDEFHVTDITDAMILGRLFKLLFERGVVVVATSNWAPDRLYEGGLQRERFLPFIALLKDRMDIVYLDSPRDYRAQVTPLEGTYFTPLGRSSRQSMERAFKALTEGEKTGPATLEVKGRTIRIAQAGGGVARFTFAELCEQPHGAEDYLKIAQGYHTILIENVPKMGYDRRNEARRFMLLIDELYEARVRVVISAAAAAEKLYYGHDHAFEFQRTVSRLTEMQGQGWP